MLAGQYVTNALNVPFSAPVVSEFVVALLVAVRLFRFSGLEKVNMVLSMVSIVPSIFFLVVTIPYLNPSRWVESTGEYNCSYYDPNLQNLTITTDDWSELNGFCIVPRNRGQLLSFSLWMW